MIPCQKRGRVGDKQKLLVPYVRTSVTSHTYRSIIIIILCWASCDWVSTAFRRLGAPGDSRRKKNSFASKIGAERLLVVLQYCSHVAQIVQMQNIIQCTPLSYSYPLKHVNTMPRAQVGLLHKEQCVGRRNTENWYWSGTNRSQSMANSISLVYSRTDGMSSWPKSVLCTTSWNNLFTKSNNSLHIYYTLTGHTHRQQSTDSTVFLTKGPSNYWTLLSRAINNYWHTPPNTINSTVGRIIYVGEPSKGQKLYRGDIPKRNSPFL